MGFFILMCECGNRATLSQGSMQSFHCLTKVIEVDSDEDTDADRISINIEEPGTLSFKCNRCGNSIEEDL